MSARNILIVSNSDDEHARIVSNRMMERSIKVHRLDSNIFTFKEHVWHINSDDTRAPSSSWYVPDVDVVWYRKVHFPKPIDATQSFVSQELEGLFECILADYSGCRWVNPRDQVARARAKIAQLQQAKKIGLRIPDTLVTTSLRALKVFSEKYGDQIVAKPIQAQVIGQDGSELVVGTRRLVPEYFESAVEPSPCYAQERLQLKSEVRVIAFGDQLHAFRLTARKKADDLKQLRLNDIQHEVTELDEDTAQKIRSLMLFNQLEFGAIDLGIVDDAAPVFLELNPNGQWLWLQYMTGKNLLDPFIDMLCS